MHRKGMCHQKQKPWRTGTSTYQHDEIYDLMDSNGIGTTYATVTSVFQGPHGLLSCSLRTFPKAQGQGSTIWIFSKVNLHVQMPQCFHPIDQFHQGHFDLYSQITHHSGYKDSESFGVFHYFPMMCFIARPAELQLQVHGWHKGVHFNEQLQTINYFCSLLGVFPSTTTRPFSMADSFCREGAGLAPLMRLCFGYHFQSIPSPS